jgi:hypothetical protein
MANLGEVLPQGDAPSTRKTLHLLWLIAWALIVVLAVAFVGMYVFRYYLNYDEAIFGPYWPRRFWLLLHISGGMLALLVGPWQFWTGLRQTVPRVHRWTGRLFLIGVTCGVIGATYLAVTTTFGWAFGVGLGGLAVAWAGSTAMAFYAIRKGVVSVHKEWMTRAYVVTFGFVTFRLFDDWLPTAQLQPEGDRAITFAWFCWAIPLFVTIVIQALMAMRRKDGEWVAP